MRNRTLAILILAAGAILGSGCQKAELTVTHILPAAVPLPPGGASVGSFTAANESTGDYPAMITRMLGERLAAALGEADATPASKVSGTVTIEITDVRGQRNIQRWDGATKAMAFVEIATLDRTVSANVDFVVRDGKTGEHLAGVEQVKTYRSAIDPRVRGELGLLRPDDPERIPAVETIVEELLSECVDGFCGMVAPVKAIQTIPLRSAWRLSAGVRAVKAGQLASAEWKFLSVIADRPEDGDALFNLGAVLEARGKLAAAAEAYGKAAALNNGADAEAKAAAKRVRLVRARLAPPKP